MNDRRIVQVSRRFGSKRRASWAAGVLALAVLAGCTIGPSTRPPLVTSETPGTTTAPPTPSSTMPTGPGGPGRTADPIDWSSCPDEIPRTDATSGRDFTVECAAVQVPKSYTNATSGVLSVAVAKATTTHTPAKAPPLVIMLDEPGSVGTHRVAQVAGSLPAEILAHFAVVVMDPRGTGDSVPIDCVSGQNSDALLAPGADPTTADAARLLADLSRGVTFDCGDMVGPDLSDYSTVLAADDLDTVRSAIGVSKIHFVGRGFGATLGAVYADRYPGRVAAAVLDGPSDPSLTPDKQATAAATANEKALASFAATCQTFTGGCPLGTDPVAGIKALIAKLGDVGAESTDGHVVSGGSALLALVALLGNQAGWPTLAGALAAAQKEDYDPLMTLLLAEYGPDNIEQHQSGRLVYQCNDSAQRLGGTALSKAVDAVRGTSPLFGPFLLGQVGVCSSWPAPETALGRLTGKGAPPVLVVGSVDDPVAPYTEVRSLVTELDSAQLLTWQSGIHGGYPTSSCVTAAVDNYLLKGAMPATGTLCPP